MAADRASVLSMEPVDSKCVVPLCFCLGLCFFFIFQQALRNQHTSENHETKSILCVPFVKIYLFDGKAEKKNGKVFCEGA